MHLYGSMIRVGGSSLFEKNIVGVSGARGPRHAEEPTHEFFEKELSRASQKRTRRRWSIIVPFRHKKEA
jgi:hypothetical protein